MNNQLIKWRNGIVRFFYKNVVRRIFFKMDPEVIHDRMIRCGRLLGACPVTRFLTSLFFNYHNPVLNQKLAGINFPNPVGLAAGFDKDAKMTEIMPAVGFGFMEAGSITGEPCAGNPKPRVWRLVESEGILVNYGLTNEGCEKISKRLSGKKFSIPLGTSIAKTNGQETSEENGGLQDYMKAFRKLSSIGSYFTVNISCPNSYGGLSFADPSLLEKLLAEIDMVETQKPVFIKLSPDLEISQIDGIIAAAKRHKVAGFICSNLTKNRNNHKIIEKNISPTGGFSGKVVEELANGLIKHVYRQTGKEFVIIGCGGIFSAQDAYKKIRLGASLVQLFTGMIFEGPQLISEINRGLVELLKKDGFKNISEAVGADVK